MYGPQFLDQKKCDRLPTNNTSMNNIKVGRKRAKSDK